LRAEALQQRGLRLLDGSCTQHIDRAQPFSLGCTSIDRSRRGARKNGCELAVGIRRADGNSPALQAGGKRAHHFDTRITAT
jgi:hypothetical protein